MRPGARLTTTSTAAARAASADFGIRCGGESSVTYYCHYGAAEPGETKEPTGGRGRPVHRAAAASVAAAAAAARRFPVRTAVQPVREQRDQRSTVPAGRPVRPVLAAGQRVLAGDAAAAAAAARFGRPTLRGGRG